MNKVSEHLIKLRDDLKYSPTLGDLLLVCVGIMDGHIFPDDTWNKYFSDTKLFINKGLFEATVRDMIDSPYLKCIDIGKDGPPMLELTPKGESKVWSKFMGEYINLQCLSKSLDTIDEVHDSLARPNIIEVNSFDDNEANISIGFQSPTEVKIFQKFLDSYETFVKKNRSYGNSSLEPVGIFGNLPREAKIESRMEDKLARIRNITDTRSHDYMEAIRDLRVYLFIYELALEDDK